MYTILLALSLLQSADVLDRLIDATHPDAGAACERRTTGAGKCSFFCGDITASCHSGGGSTFCNISSSAGDHLVSVTGTLCP